MTQIVFHVGGPEFHPVAEQAALIQQWLGDAHQYQVHDGIDAFDHLDGCDLLVLMGLHWTLAKTGYRPMADQHKAALKAYIASGRPVLVHHGACASYDDWPAFGSLIGVRWTQNATTHSPVGTYTMRALPTGHPIVAGLGEYTIFDEIYYWLDLNGDMRTSVHAEVEWDGVKRPMIITGEGGRVAGAGKMVYLANGHGMRAMECPAMKTIWTNAVNWLLQP